VDSATNGYHTHVMTAVIRRDGIGWNRNAVGERQKMDHKQIGMKPDLFDGGGGGERAGYGAKCVVCDYAHH